MSVCDKLLLILKELIVINNVSKSHWFKFSSVPNGVVKIEKMYTCLHPKVRKILD